MFVRPQRDQFGREEERLECLVDAVKIACDVSEAFGVRTVPVWVELDVVEIGRRTSFGNLADPIAKTHRFDDGFIDVPRDRVVVGIGERNGNVERLRQIDLKILVIVCDCCFQKTDFGAANYANFQ